MTGARALSATLSVDQLVDEAHVSMGVAGVESALEGVARVRQDVMAAATSPAEVSHQIVAELLGGTPATGDMVDRLGDAVASAERHEAVLGWLDNVRSSLSSAVETTRATALDDGLAVLRPRVVDVLDEARPAVTALGSATTADEAVAADVVDAWREVVRLAADHDAIRTAQRRLVMDSSPRSDRTTRLVDVYGHVENAERYADIGRYLEALTDHVRRAHGLTGAAIDPPNLPWLHGSATDRLRFAWREDVTPWCPTWQEMLAAENTARASRADELAQAVHQGQDEAPGAHGRRVLRSSSSSLMT